MTPDGLYLQIQVDILPEGALPDAEDRPAVEAMAVGPLEVLLFVNLESRELRP